MPGTDCIKRCRSPGDTSQLNRPNSYKYSCSNKWSYKKDKFRKKTYIYHINTNETKVRILHIYYIPIMFPKNLVVTEGLVYIKIEIKPPEKRYPHCIIPNSTANNPSNQLAFKLSYHIDSSEEVS